MELKLRGKSALVLASSAGIGKAIAAALYREGANVCLASRSAEKLSAAHAELFDPKNPARLVKQMCDLSRPDAAPAIVAFARSELGSIDILVNNQGGPPAGGFSAVSEDQLQGALQTNLLSVIAATRLCLPDMEKKRWGRILNVLSISAKEPIPNLFLSNLIRPAVLGMSKTIAQEKAHLGITVNSLLPSAVLTDRTRSFAEARAAREKRPIDEVLKETAAAIPAGYLASPEEVGAIATFLCSDHASYLNGAALALDGASSRSLY